MPEAPLTDQLWTVGWSGIIGFVIGIFYTLIQLIRNHCRSTGLKTALDAAFGIGATVTFFVFVIGIARSRLRAFIPLSMFMGFIIWLYTGRRLLLFLIRKIQNHRIRFAKTNKIDTQNKPLHRVFLGKSRKK